MVSTASDSSLLNSESGRDRGFWVFNLILSTAAIVFLSWLLHLRTPNSTWDLSFMPSVNAVLNGVSAFCLVMGRVMIKRGLVRAHRYFMVSAFGASSLFLVGYVLYHAAHGDTSYPGEGWAKIIYLVILASHILLSLFVVPLALGAFYYAWRRRFDAHKKLVRVALPIWLYVSVTGVLVYLFLHQGLFL